jgi:hypothetical protein
VPTSPFFAAVAAVALATPAALAAVDADAGQAARAAIDAQAAVDVTVDGGLIAIELPSNDDSDITSINFACAFS